MPISLQRSLIQKQIITKLLVTIDVKNIQNGLEKITTSFILCYVSSQMQQYNVNCLRYLYNCQLEFNKKCWVNLNLLASQCYSSLEYGQIN